MQIQTSRSRDQVSESRHDHYAGKDVEGCGIDDLAFALPDEEPLDDVNRSEQHCRVKDNVDYFEGFESF